jgi:predicted nucleic acid-binding protein
MNLLNNQKKIFVTESVWVSLMDESHQQHSETKTKFKNVLDHKNKLMTSTYVLDAVIEYLKGNVSIENARQFLEVIDKAVLTDSIKVLWLNRRIRRKMLMVHLENDAKKIRDTFNVSLIQQKKIDFVFTLHNEFYESKDLACL